MRLTVSDSLNSDYQEVFIYVQDGGNMKPEIALSQPTNNGTYIIGQTIPFAASADDLDGKITHVNFWINNALTHSDSSAPFEFRKSMPLGTHQFFAVAYDDQNDSAVSSTHKFSVISIAGDWRLEPIAGALAVGPNAGSLTWWSNSLADVNTRSCLFDDVYQISENGTFQNILGRQTWLEGWQNAGKETCGDAVAPHTGATAGSWNIDSISGEFVLNGKGQYLGLPKATNNGELGAGATEPDFRKYQITLNGNKLTAGINFGTGYWQFKFVKATPSTGVVKNAEAAATIVPNPASQRIEIVNVLNVKGVKIFDPSGRLLLMSIEKTIDISGLPDGLYLVVIETPTGQITSRILKSAE
jgi:hypothetical protein